MEGDLQGRDLADLHREEKCSEVQLSSTAHLIFMAVRLHEGRALCSPICKKKDRIAVPVILSENKVKKQSDAGKSAVCTMLSQ